jgi:hypothetical protein
MGYRGLGSFGCRQGCCEHGNEPRSAVKYGTSRERLCFMELVIRTGKEKIFFFLFEVTNFELHATFTYLRVANIITYLQRSPK